MKVLVVAEVADGRLADVTHEMVTAARQVSAGASVELGVVAAEPQLVVDELAIDGIDGIDAVVTAALPSADFDAEQQQAAVTALIRHAQPDLVLIAHSIRGASYGAALAEALDIGFASDVIRLWTEDDGNVLVERPAYGGKALATLALPTDVASLLLVRTSVFDPAPEGPAPTSVTEVPASVPTEGRVRHLEYLVPEAGLDLKRANVILAVGRGIGDAENVALYTDLAEQMGAMLGASRPVVDAGWLPATHQVGQTGTTVKPQLYIAFGISGALQHLAGMSGSKTIVAVNTDEAAPIFNVADVGAVADVAEVAERLRALLS